MDNGKNLELEKPQLKLPACQGTAEQILAERVAVKIGMIIRRATLVVAGTTRCQGAQRHERPILPQPHWDGALRAVCLVRLLAKGNAPQSVARGTLRSEGSGSGGDVKTARRTCWGVCIPLRGRIFLRKTLLCPSRSHHSRRRLSRIPSRKAAVAPTEICSAVPQRIARSRPLLCALTNPSIGPQRRRGTPSHTPVVPAPLCFTRETSSSRWIIHLRGIRANQAMAGYRLDLMAAIKARPATNKA